MIKIPDDTKERIGRWISSGDRRIVYGARCLWWDSIGNARMSQDFPRCPRCGSVLMEVPTIEEWNAGMDAYEQDGHPGYRTMMEWSRGKCFKTMAELEQTYKAGGPI